MAEVVKHIYPRAVDLHNYTKSSSMQQKYANWETLNQKVLRRMNFVVHEDDIKDVINAKRGAVERVLLFVRKQLAAFESTEAGQLAMSQGGLSPPGDFSSRLSKGRPSSNSHARASSPPSSSSSSSRVSAAPPEAPSRGESSAAPAPAPTVIAPRGSISGATRGGAATSASSSTASASSAQPTKQLHAANVPEAKVDKDAIIQDLRETVEIMQEKISKLEQLVALKNNKIALLTKKLEASHS